MKLQLDCDVLALTLMGDPVVGGTIFSLTVTALAAVFIGATNLDQKTA